MSKLVSRENMAEAVNLDSRNPLVGIMYRISGVEKVNRFYEQINHLKGESFIEGSLDLLDLQLEFDEEELKRIPEDKPFITISNHPFGAIDGISLISVVTKRRKDFRVMANFLLSRVEQMGEYFIGVNPFEEGQTNMSSFRGMKEALRHLSEGKPLGIFPAGEVSAFNRDLGTVTDSQWSTASLKLIKKAGVPVVPIYFDGKNSRLFHLLGVIHPSLRTLRLPAEFMNKKGKTMRLRIGKPIPPKDLDGFETLEQLGRFLRAKTYALGSSVEVKREYFGKLTFPKKPDDIIPPVPTELLEKDLSLLQGKILFEQAEFVCYIARSGEIPHLLREIGRLREITFRGVGEGTNKSMDIDEYDFYYEHLILWDRKEKALAGAYRIGKGHEIMRKYGSKGFYTHSLFRMSAQMNPILDQSIELGRSFIVESYQRHRLPLFMLWKGILMVLISEPHHRYVIGPVTISGSYQEISKGLIMEFVKRYYFDQELSQYVTPRKAYTVKIGNVDSEALLSATDNDLKKLDKIISDIEPSSFTMPVLLKKYLHQNAKILGFNVDPKFNNALDGMMLLDLHNLPQETIDNLQHEFNQLG
ncbi:MAG: GNAT family N-acetyltransferase [Cryomorphaceae bacterium]|nr:GNAT family N-acetyltransferase [Cryomorphaceae bacterium]